MQEIEPLRVDAQYFGAYREPAFGFLRWAHAYETIYRTFGPIVRPEEIKWEGQGSPPADLLIECNLLRIETAIRFRLMNVDAYTATVRTSARSSDWAVTIGRIASVARGLAGGAAEENTMPLFNSHSITIGVHWRTAAGFLKECERWTRDSPAGFAATAVSFASSQKEESARLTVNLQPSLSQPDPANAFISVRCDFGGSESPADFVPRALVLTTATLRRFGLGLQLTQ